MNKNYATVNATRAV
jgi:hypothetical protein